MFGVSNTHSCEDEFNLNLLLLSFLFISYLCILFLTSTTVHQLPNISISNGFIIIIIINKTYYQVSSKKNFVLLTIIIKNNINVEWILKDSILTKT